MNNFKYGDSIFVGFKDGKLIRNTQNYPRMYKTEKDLKRWMPEYDDTVNITEYRVVHYGKWITGVYGSILCSNCKHCGNDDGIKTDYCPNCGAIMNLEDFNAKEN